MKKILHIIGSMGDGGAQRVIYDYLVHRGELNNYEIAILSLGEKTDSTYDKNIEKNHMPVYYLKRKKSSCSINLIRSVINYSYLVYAILKFIREYKPSAIHTHISPIMCIMLIPFVIYHGKKFHTMHSDPYRFTPFQVLITKICFHFFNVIPIAVSEGQKEKAIARYNLDSCDVLKNSVDISYIKSECVKTTKQEQRKLYGLPLDGFIIGSVGRLHPIKNYDGLIKIFAEYEKINSNAYLVIAGEGSEREKLEQLASELEIKEKVFLIGNIEQHKIYRFYRALDIFTLVSHSESSSLVTIEAQAVGIRCVIADSIPADAIYRNDVQRLSKDASKDEWIKAFANENYVNNTPYGSDDMDIKTLMARLEAIYDKYIK